MFYRYTTRVQFDPQQHGGQVAAGHEMGGVFGGGHVRSGVPTPLWVESVVGAVPLLTDFFLNFQVKKWMVLCILL